ncbi:MAG TPA: hypothetical protein PKH33_07715 [bacterium]|nr:hypothetical protein [bacterium]
MISEKAKAVAVFAILSGVLFITGLITGVLLERRIISSIEHEESAQAETIEPAATSKTDAEIAAETEKARLQLIDQYINSAPKEKADMVRDLFISKLDAELLLEDGQEQNIRTILEKYEGEFILIRSRIRADMDILRAKVEGEMADELNEDQKETYFEIMKKLH